MPKQDRIKLITRRSADLQCDGKRSEALHATNVALAKEGRAFALAAQRTHWRTKNEGLPTMEVVCVLGADSRTNYARSF